jgi:hypothetical protein
MNSLVQVFSLEFFLRPAQQFLGTLVDEGEAAFEIDATRAVG